MNDEQMKMAALLVMKDAFKAVYEGDDRAVITICGDLIDQISEAKAELMSECLRVIVGDLSTYLDAEERFNG